MNGDTLELLFPLLIPPFLLGMIVGGAWRSWWGLAVVPAILTAGLIALVATIWNEVDCYSCVTDFYGEKRTHGDWAWFFTVLVSTVWASALIASILGWLASRGLKRIAQAPSAG